MYDSRMFQFKQHVSDFIVSELIHVVPGATGTVLLVHIEKRNQTTMEILDHLTHTTGIPRWSIGIGGLKDKYGITRQWISIYKKTLAIYGGMSAVLWSLERICRVLEYGRSDHMLSRWDHRGNRFTITLRYDAISQTITSHTEKILQQIKTYGFPNRYGEQRFGQTGKNHEIWRDILRNGHTMGDRHEDKFKIQAYVSSLFNDYIEEKMKIWLLDGDILIDGSYYYLYRDSQTLQFDYRGLVAQHKHQPFFWPRTGVETTLSDPERLLSWPMIGHNLLVCPMGTAASKAEIQRLKSHEVSFADLVRFIPSQTFGVRRPLWCMPSHFSRSRSWKQLVLQVDLPPGSYASVLVDQLKME